jgi:hypothetical protein
MRPLSAKQLQWVDWLVFKLYSLKRGERRGEERGERREEERGEGRGEERRGEERRRGERREERGERRRKGEVEIRDVCVGKKYDIHLIVWRFDRPQPRSLYQIPRIRMACALARHACTPLMSQHVPRTFLLLLLLLLLLFISLWLG